MKQKRKGRPPTPCPRCGKGKREFRVQVQCLLIGTSKGGRTHTLTVCPTCAGQLEAALSMLLYGTSAAEGHTST